jgi:hypothetical protein
MMTIQEEELMPVQSARKPRWLPLLEQALKDRIGWVDEAVSPFARASLAENCEAELPRAA